MNFDFSPAIEKLETMWTTLIASLPNIIVALVVLMLFYLGARVISALVKRLSGRYHQHENVGLVFGRLAQWLTVLIGVLVTAVVRFPNFTPARMIDLLGIGSVAK